ncbi:glycogen synthase [Myxococcus xanthus DK 1622]|uniref:Glycogen synthase n=1 Tax=Myxococcus xanthus (strain DK1622) TaxID=246197 RepID=GLGA_MYXXD|nr:MULTISPECIES: glycogen synthase GlgA [Myxococcus]Q1DCS0.1 RecName: Full=Glycogen synthase; AltName: Full=Starch [bacterial glycogen] synthase [Myxococcus xanthus DK 1622]ABF89473.1 glycogen synthase [Myxococcus xanthus DK 1622]NOJ56420.1 glycogen synthase GlgA [Myxococcus xanthus]QPM80937.1 glycogen synthase GlgA [Myxococcus xanthus]QVW69997.1 glycogen synthase GlgA [Myxococcus xanthus DZ2]QZZ48826.1 Glycogen synthase [Myxococcus xanthus]
MNVLFISSEVAPFSKTGGLGDVAGALPAALASLGHDVKVITPRYRDLRGAERLEPTGQSLLLRFPFGELSGPILSARVSERLEVLFLENAFLFGNRHGLYGDAGGAFADNHRRFAYLSVGALQAAQRLRFIPDIIHANDWQTGLVPVALRRGFQTGPLAHAKSVFTIHNLAYQGQFPKDVMGDLALPWDLFTAHDGLEFHDTVNFLKAGLVFSDALTTVSPTYAREIQTPEQGYGLDGLLRHRAHRLHGILNGVDTHEWNPEDDAFLPARYGLKDLSGKAVCKRELLARFGLEDGPAPVFGFVSRLAWQKGMDLLLEALPAALHADIRVVGVGSGEGPLEEGLLALQSRYPKQVGVHIGFDPGLSHLVEAGADFFLMPSRYEPCGLNQMYSLRYGTVPIVRATGGLVDTVEGGLDGNGILFEAFHKSALLAAIRRALALYADPSRLDEFRRRGMEKDFSWGASGRRYEALFHDLVAE